MLLVCAIHSRQYYTIHQLALHQCTKGYSKFAENTSGVHGPHPNQDNKHLSNKQLQEPEQIRVEYTR